jgi:hypothetical protein
MQQCDDDPAAYSLVYRLPDMLIYYGYALG